MQLNIKDKNRKWLVLGIFFLGIFALYSWFVEHMDVHYKLTVNVQTPEGIVSGSTVREVTNTAFRYKLIKWPNVTNPADIRGEAVVVDMGERGILFGLMSNDLYRGFPVNGASTHRGLKYFNSLDVGEKVELTNKRHWPEMVMFKDINNPKSVYRVDTNMIKSVTIEITDEPITRKVRKYLPWLDNYYNQRLDGNRFGTSKSNYPEANQFAAGSFSTFRERK